MAVTQTSSLSNAATVVYENVFLTESIVEEVWGRFIDWEAIQEGRGGTSYDYGAYTDMAPALTALTEDSDIVPVTLGDTNITVTPNEYGNAVSISKKLRWSARTRVREDAIRMMGANRARSVDRLCRNGVLGGSNTRYPGTNTARTDLTGSGDQVSYAFLTALLASAYAAGLKPFEGNVFAAIVPFELQADIVALTEFKEVEYRAPSAIFEGLPGFTFAGFRFIPHRAGKLYLSGGTVAQAATTLSSAVVAGATSAVVASATGLAAGDYITLGTLEANDAEQVQITAVAGTTLTIKGGGNSPGNLGCAYAHASGAAVTEAPNVAAIPVIGKNSTKGVYGADGRYGVLTLAEGLDILQTGGQGRFVYPGWTWFGGVGIWPRYVIRGECVASLGHIGVEY